MPDSGAAIEVLDTEIFSQNFSLLSTKYIKENFKKMLLTRCKSNQFNVGQHRVQRLRCGYLTFPVNKKWCTFTFCFYFQTSFVSSSGFIIHLNTYIARGVPISPPILSLVTTGKGLLSISGIKKNNIKYCMSKRKTLISTTGTISFTYPLRAPLRPTKKACPQ